MEIYSDYRRYGTGAFPVSGGLEAQPVEWKEALDCALEAKEAADWELEVEDTRRERESDNSE